MARTTPSIEQLPTATQSKLRSTQILTSLPQVISELIQNALDAGAHQVDVGVDCEEWECWVRDDGAGISRDGLLQLGKGPKEGRYNTSKAYTPASLDEGPTFGFRGEALASAADLSCLEISSRTARSRESWSIILKGGANLYSGPSLRWRRESPGTVVCVRDAFYNLPIRRLSHPSPAKTVELIRRELEIYALMFSQVSFSFENTNRTREGRSERVRVMTIPKTSSSLITFRLLFGRALAEHVEEIHETQGEMKIEGFISLEGAHSKAYQFLYLNHHPLTPCELQRMIDTKFATSTFAKHAFDEQGETSQPRSTVRRSPRKSEKKPIYVLNINIPPRNVDNCLEPGKATVHLRNAEVVASFLSSVIQAFLIRHGFATQAARTTRSNTNSPSPRKRRKIAEDKDPTRYRGQNLARTGSSQVPPTAPLVVLQDDDALGVHEDQPHVLWIDPHTGLRFMVDKRTGNSYSVDAPPPANRDEGNSEPRGSRRRRMLLGPGQSPFLSSNVDTPEWIREALLANKSFALTEPAIPSIKLSSSFVDEMQQYQSSRICCDANGRRPFSSQSRARSRWKDAFSGGPDTAQFFSARFTREDLRRVQILGQVDRKFIACVIDSDSGNPDVNPPTEGNDEDTGCRRTLDGDAQSRALVLIDQHAADERVRVERFLHELCSGFLQQDFRGKSTDSNYPSELCEVKRQSLVPPFPVLLTKREAAQISSSQGMREVCGRWGFSFNLDRTEDAGDIDALRSPGKSDNGYRQVMVQSVPKILGDKLLMDDELRDVVKGFIAHLETIGLPENAPLSSQGSGWQRALRWCPKELLDLVNSKACRGAIMFNDPLTLDQCRRLVEQLSETCMPFQCAHGRPSLAPLVNIAGVNVVQTGHLSSTHVDVVNWENCLV